MNRYLFQTVRLSIKNLLVYKMRAILAALGIFIGTATVIWLVAMGEGVSYRAQQQILELGATNIIVRTKEPMSASDGQDANSRVKKYGLRLRDLLSGFRERWELILDYEKYEPWMESPENLEDILTIKQARETPEEEAISLEEYEHGRPATLSS